MKKALLCKSAAEKENLIRLENLKKYENIQITFIINFTFYLISYVVQHGINNTHNIILQISRSHPLAHSKRILKESSDKTIEEMFRLLTVNKYNIFF